MESVSRRVAPITGVFAAGVLAPGSREEPPSPARPQIPTCRGLSGSCAPGFRVTWHRDCKHGQGQAACAGDMFVTSTKLGPPHPRSPAPGAGGKVRGDTPPAGISGRGHCSCLERRPGRGRRSLPGPRRPERGSQPEPEDANAGHEDPRVRVKPGACLSPSMCVTWLDSLRNSSSNLCVFSRHQTPC